MKREISNTQDVIDSREIIERIEELQGERDAHNEDESRDGEPWELHYAEDAAELKALEDVAKQGEELAPDWKHGETMINDRHFERYAQDLAEECDMIPKGLGWPCNCIDWEHAARELQYDYSAIDFDGVTYWVRS